MKNKVILLILMTLSLYAETFSISTTEELRAALSSSAENDIIYLAPGTYKTTDDLGGSFVVRNVTIIGAITGETILNGNNTDTVVTGYNARLENLTITHGNNVNDQNRGAGINGNSYTIINCIISDSNAEYMATYGSALHGNDNIVINTLFYNNTGTNYGQYYGSNMTVINSIFIGGDFNAIYPSSSSEFEVIKNNVFIDNRIYDRYDRIEDTANTTYSLAELDNLFIDFNNGDYQLKLDSALINAGTQDTNGTTLPDTDMIGNPRVIDSTIDIGPYEFHNEPGTPDAISTTKELRAALSSSAENDIIYLAPGTYKTTDDLGGSFVVRNVTIIGAITGETILNGNNTDTVVTGYNARLENLTITHGNNVNDQNRGAGINGNSYTIINCIISDSNAEYWATYGSALYGNDNIVINTLFYNNTGTNYGQYYGSNIVAINSIFIEGDTKAIYDQGIYDSGAGKYVASPNGVLRNNMFVDNQLYLQYGNAIEENNTHYNLSEIQDFFIDFDNGDYRLKLGSALINAGTQDTNGTTLPDTDMIGNPRVIDSTIDIGPYEYHSNTKLITPILMYLLN